MKRLSIIFPILSIAILLVVVLWYFSPSGKHFRFAYLSDADLVALTSRETQDASAWLELGKRMELRKMNREALSDYLHATEADPKKQSAWEGVARMATVQHEPVTAHDAAEHLLIIAPRDGASLGIAGRTLYLVGDREAARDTLKEAVALNPKDAPNWNALSQVLIDVHILDEAVQAAQTATRLSPDTAEYYVTLSRAERLLSRPQDALSAIRQARKLAPDNSEVLLEAGTLATLTVRSATEKTEAKNILFAARDGLKGTNREVEPLRLLGQCYLSERQYSRAQSLFEECLRVAPGDSAAQFSLSRVLALQGRTAEAQALTKRYSNETEYQLTVRQLQMRLKREPNRTDLRNRLKALQASHNTTSPGSPYP